MSLSAGRSSKPISNGEQAYQILLIFPVKQTWRRECVRVHTLVCRLHVKQARCDIICIFNPAMLACFPLWIRGLEKTGFWSQPWQQVPIIPHHYPSLGSLCAPLAIYLFILKASIARAKVINRIPSILALSSHGRGSVGLASALIVP